MFKKIFTIVIVSVLVISCNKEDDEASVYEPRKNLLLKTTDSDGSTVTYTYGSNNLLTNSKSHGKSSPSNYEDLDYIYNIDGTLSKVTKASDGSTVNEFIYDSNKKIIKLLNSNGDIKFSYTYTKNEIIQYEQSTYTTITYIYEDNGNIGSKKNSIYPPATSSPTQLLAVNGHDDKMNPESSLPEAYNFPRSVNNIRYIYYDKINKLTDTNVYEYNVDNYPIKVTHYDGTNSANNYTRTYEYKQL